MQIVAWEVSNEMLSVGVVDMVNAKHSRFCSSSLSSMIVIFTHRLLLSSVITRVPLMSLKSPGAKKNAYICM